MIGGSEAQFDSEKPRPDEHEATMQDIFESNLERINSDVSDSKSGQVQILDSGEQEVEEVEDDEDIVLQQKIKKSNYE